MFSIVNTAQFRVGIVSASSIDKCENVDLHKLGVWLNAERTVDCRK